MEAAIGVQGQLHGGWTEAAPVCVLIQENKEKIGEGYKYTQGVNLQGQVIGTTETLLIARSVQLATLMPTAY